MPDITKETITTNENNEESAFNKVMKRQSTSIQTAGYFIYFLFGVLDVLLAFRFVFKILGANPTSGFVDFIYGLSAIFVAPFAGIFNTSLANGSVVTSVFEPATLVAFFVYAVIAWGIVALINVFSGRSQNE